MKQVLLGRHPLTVYNKDINLEYCMSGQRSKLEKLENLKQEMERQNIITMSEETDGRIMEIL